MQLRRSDESKQGPHRLRTNRKAHIDSGLTGFRMGIKSAKAMSALKPFYWHGSAHCSVGRYRAVTMIIDCDEPFMTWRQQPSTIVTIIIPFLSPTHHHQCSAVTVITKHHYHHRCRRHPIREAGLSRLRRTPPALPSRTHMCVRACVCACVRACTHVRAFPNPNPCAMSENRSINSLKGGMAVPGFHQRLPNCFFLLWKKRSAGSFP